MEWGVNYETRQAQAVAKARDQGVIEISGAWENVGPERFVELFGDRVVFERSWRQTAIDVARVEGIPASLLPDYLGAFWLAVDGWAKDRVARHEKEKDTLKLSLNRQLTVGELSDFLAALPRGGLVNTEGCDCIGKSNGAEVDADGQVTILRWEGS